ncbi:MAG: o-succinylbenzoate--CoA ligase [Gemmatimonadales bacterium]
MPNLGQILNHRARRHPDRLALVEATRGKRFSYRELEQRANRIAGGLARLGVRAGDRVALLMLNGVEFVESYFALAKLGAVLVPLNFRLAPAELDFILRDAGVETLLYDREYEETVTALRDGGLEPQRLIAVGDRYAQLRESGRETEPAAGVAGDDPLLIMYTSGTTGRPKGAVHTHASFSAASTAVNLTCDIRDGDRELVVLPLFHIGALLPLTWVLHHGGTGVVLRSFDADLAIRVLESERITTGLVVPTIFEMLLDHPRFESIDHSSLRSLVVGGAPVPPPLARRSKEAGITALQDYGSTEAAVVTIASEDEFLTKPMSAGRPLIHTEVRIVDDDGQSLPAGEVGEIVVRGNHLMAGYWGRPEATANAFRDGWFHTGDLGSLDGEGCLFVRDRKNDLIISGGENIYPAEVERVLAEWPRVREAAVIGQPSAKWGESPVAVVVPQPGPPITADELVDYCRGRLAGYKIPRQVVVVDTLPRTPTGKVQKHLLRLRFPGPAPH